MPGRAKSNREKTAIVRETIDGLYDAAACLYKEDHAPGVTWQTLGRKPFSYRKCCDKVYENYISEHGAEHTLHFSITLILLIKASPPRNTSPMPLFSVSVKVVSPRAPQMQAEGGSLNPKHPFSSTTVSKWLDVTFLFLMKS